MPKITKKFRQQFPEIPEIVLQLLSNRGLITQEKIDEFLSPDYLRDIYDPFLFRDMKKAVKKIFKAIEKNELIIIHGDYDADGVCAAAILLTALKNMGAKHLDVFLPDRELEGYGINKNTVEVVAAAGAKLLISCDCGISNKSEIERAKELGVSVIITDHHHVPKELPPADAIIHPQVPGETYPDKGLSGSGVAFKLAQALIKNAGTTHELHLQNSESFEKWLLDLVAIATVADMVPLLGESRTLTKYGLIVLNKTKRLGLQKLFDLCRGDSTSARLHNITTHEISFQIAPRLNAAGRMKHANAALQLLLSETTEEALELSRELNSNNQKRQKETEQMVNQAYAQIEETNQAALPIISVIMDNWPIGLIGLIASKLSNHFYKPVIVMTKKDGIIHGSGRSIDEIDIMEKMVRLKDYFEKYGGHPQACGFTFKYDTSDTNRDAPAANSANEILEKFKRDLTKIIEEETEKKSIIPTLIIDAEIKLDEIDWDFYDWLQKFEPFGEANRAPAFLARKISVAACEGVGNNGRHLRLLARQDSNLIHKMIGFSFGDEKIMGKNWCQILKPGDELDVIFELSMNEWNGERELQKKIIDLRFHKAI